MCYKVNENVNNYLKRGDALAKDRQKRQKKFRKIQSRKKLMKTYNGNCNDSPKYKAIVNEYDREYKGIRLQESDIKINKQEFLKAERSTIDGCQSSFKEN